MNKETTGNFGVEGTGLCASVQGRETPHIEQSAKGLRKLAPKPGFTYAKVRVEFLLDAKDCERVNRVLADFQSSILLPDGWTPAKLLEVEAMAELRRDDDRITRKQEGAA